MKKILVFTMIMLVTPISFFLHDVEAKSVSFINSNDVIINEEDYEVLEKLGV